MIRFWLVTLLALASCGTDETISAFVPEGAVYRVTSVSGTPVTYRATLTFPAAGAVQGDGPCNRYQASQSAPYPWFSLGPIAATRRACPDLGAESAFFEALSAMTIIEVSGGTLILSNEDGGQMAFEQTAP